MTALSAVQVHDPELVLVLGDQLDEGGLPTPQSDWEVLQRPLVVVDSSRCLLALVLPVHRITSHASTARSGAFGRSRRSIW